MSTKFKVGDAIIYNTGVRNYKGVIVYIETDNIGGSEVEHYLLDLQNFRGHNGGGLLKTHTGYWVPANSITLDTPIAKQELLYRKIKQLDDAFKKRQKLKQILKGE